VKDALDERCNSLKAKKEAEIHPPVLPKTEKKHEPTFAD